MNDESPTKPFAPDENPSRRDASTLGPAIDFQLMEQLAAVYPLPLAAPAEEVRRALSEAARRLANGRAEFELAEYEILGSVAHGGMGIVYKAWQPQLKRMVAIKTIKGGSSAPERVERFRVEAQAVARLQHPHIVQIHAFGERDDGPWLAMEWIEGGGLDRRLQQGPMTIRVAAEFVRTLARAVQHAHREGIVHRDLKPANILLTADGEPKIADFGLARFLEDSQGLTQTGELLGTPGYMAPEQAAGRAADAGPACDIWALGTILYECLTGRRAFDATNWRDSLRQVQDDDPIPPKRVREEIPRELEAVCLKCLAKKPGDRYASASDLADDLDRFLAGEPVLARSPTLVRRFDRWLRKQPDFGALGLAFLIVGSISAALVSARIHFLFGTIAFVLGWVAATRSGVRELIVGYVAGALALVATVALSIFHHEWTLANRMIPTIAGSPLLLVALASVCWRDGWIARIAIVIGLGILAAGLPFLVNDPWIHGSLAAGAAIAATIARYVAGQYAASTVTVTLTMAIGTLFGSGCGAIVAGTSGIREPRLQYGIGVGIAIAGAYLGAMMGANRRRGAQFPFGVFPHPGPMGPAATFRTQPGSDIALSPAQLKELATHLEQTGKSIHLRPYHPNNFRT
jgi:predicted Ser/Thr protein kinase